MVLGGILRGAETVARLVTGGTARLARTAREGVSRLRIIPAPDKGVPINKVIAGAPMSKIPQTTLTSSLPAGTKPILVRSSRVTRLTPVSKGGRRLQTIPKPKGLTTGQKIGIGLGVGTPVAGFAIEELTGTGGARAGGAVGVASGLLSSGKVGKIRKIGGAIGGGIGGLFGGDIGADISEGQAQAGITADAGLTEGDDAPRSRSTPRKSSKPRKKSTKKRTARKRMRKSVRHPRGCGCRMCKPEKAHKATVHRGLDKFHKHGKKGVSLKMIRAMIDSPKTPEHLKKVWRKKLREKSRHIHG